VLAGVSDVDYPWQCCLGSYSTKENSITAAALAVGATTRSLVAQWSATIGIGVCDDLLGGVALKAAEEGSLMNSFVSHLDSLVSGRACQGDCPFLRPLCKAGQCVGVSCDDIKDKCNEDSQTGIQARLMCSRTCGCGTILDPLLFNGEDYGCPPQCVHESEQELGDRGCADLRPGSTEITAYATSQPISQRLLPLEMNATIWNVLGCRALDFLDIYKSGFCDETGALAAVGLKSFKPFCPMTCGCMGEALGSLGCPGQCPVEPTTQPCADLSDAQIGVVSGIMDQIQGRTPYPGGLSCRTVTAAVCSSLNRRYNNTDPGAVFENYNAVDPLPAIYHPCPVACKGGVPMSTLSAMGLQKCGFAIQLGVIATRSDRRPWFVLWNAPGSARGAQSQARSPPPCGRRVGRCYGISVVTRAEPDRARPPGRPFCRSRPLSVPLKFQPLELAM
jgi:hypothetical protein